MSRATSLVWQLSGSLKDRSHCIVAVAQFSYVVRKRIKLMQEQALWIFVEGQKDGKRFEIFPPAT